jgi:hypothetical protein
MVLHSDMAKHQQQGSNDIRDTVYTYLCITGYLAMTTPRGTTMLAAMTHDVRGSAWSPSNQWNEKAIAEAGVTALEMRASNTALTYIEIKR